MAPLSPYIIICNRPIGPSPSYDLPLILHFKPSYIILVFACIMLNTSSMRNLGSAVHHIKVYKTYETSVWTLIFLAPGVGNIRVLM